MAVSTACAAFGQSAGTPLHFEVVSIKPAPPPVDGGYKVRMRSDPGRMEYSSFSLKAIIQRACEVQDFQISGPDWMALTRFDVVAKPPADTPKSRVPEMLRSQGRNCGRGRLDDKLSELINGTLASGRQ